MASLIVTATSQTLLANSNTPVLLDSGPTTCGGCVLAGFTATSSSFSALSGISAVIPTASYIVFEGYSITSAYSSNGSCITTTGSLLNVSPLYSVLKPASIPTSVFLPTAVSSFVDYLGLPTCIGGVNDVPVSSITLAQLLPSATSTGSPIPSTGNPTEASTSTSYHHHLDEQATIGIGIAIPVVVIALLLLAVFLWRRSRKIKKANVTEVQDTISEDRQPYLQQKAELEAEEKRKHELEAEERRYELDGESRIHEISENSHGLPSLRARQELRGEDHSKELDAS